jgi:hypothetical protein
MLTVEEALQRAAEFLAAESASWESSAVRIIPEDAFVERGRLIVPYDHVEYLDEGREGMRLAGNDPIAVDLETGSSTYVSPEEAEDLMDRGLL